MKFECKRSALRLALSQVESIAEGKGVLPILKNVLIAPQDGRISLTAWDSAVKLSAMAWCDGAIDGSATVPMAELKHVLGCSTASEARGETLNDTALMPTLRLTLGNAAVRLPAMPVADFPPAPLAEGEIVHFESAALAEAINAVAFAAEAEDWKPVLTGIKMEISGQDFTFIAADGFRLAVFFGRLAEPVSAQLEAIIPVAAMRYVAQMCEGQREMEAQIAKNTITFTGQSRLTARLIEGEFPKWRPLIPAPSLFGLTVEREALLEAARLLKVVGEREIVRLNVNEEGLLKLWARTDDSNPFVSVALQGKLFGSPGRLAMGLDYLLQMVESLPAGDVTLLVEHSSQAFILRPALHERQLVVQMPMFVAWSAKVSEEVTA